MKLPILRDDNQVFQLMKSKWSSILNVLLDNQSLQSNILKNITLTVGTNNINHLLGRPLVGWRIIRINGVASIYDSQDTNQMPDKTLILVSSAAVKISMEVF